MNVNPDDTKAILNDVIAALPDSEEAIRDAAPHAENSYLKLMLIDFATQRARFIGELQNEIERLGDSNAPAEASQGRFIEAWMNLKAALTSSHDQALINELQRGEKAVIKSYELARKSAMPQYIREILERQLEEIGSVIAHLERAKANFSPATKQSS